MVNNNVIISLIDYGIGNIKSVQQAFENQGAKVVRVNKAEDILMASHLVLPGVGAFGKGMAALEERDLIDCIQKYCDGTKPFLGICLGMQMMLDESEEFGVYKGLGIIHGKVRKIPEYITDGKIRKVPHIGWNKIVFDENEEEYIFKGVKIASEMYFVHSFTAYPDDDNNRLADTFYEGERLCAAISKGKCVGTQFHPEKSGTVGLKIIKNFINM